MPTAYTMNFYHTTFSPKQWANLITPALEERLYPFLGGILRDLAGARILSRTHLCGNPFP